MKTTQFESPPYDFRLAPEQQPPPDWRVLFRAELHFELRFDDRLPKKYGGYGSKRPTEVEPEEEVAIASWVLGRLAYVLGVEEGDVAGLIRRTSTKETAIGLDVQDSGRLIAQVQLVLTQEEVRLAGRMARSDLDDPIAKALREVLLAHPEELADIKVPIAPGIELGRDGGRLLGSRPRAVDWGPTVQRVIAGEEVERLADDREERCPLSRDDIAKEFLLSSRRPAWKPPKVVYVQSLVLGNDGGWVFRVTAGRERLHAVVRSVKGDPKVEWWG